MPDFAPSTAQRRPVVALTGPWNSLYDTCMPSLASMSDASSESGASTPVAPAHVPGNAGRLEPEFARTGPSSPAPGRALQRVPCSHPATKTGPLLGGASGGGPAGLPAAFAAETLACLDSSREALRNALVVLAAGRADLALVLLNADVALLMPTWRQPAPTLRAQSNDSVPWK